MKSLFTCQQNICAHFERLHKAGSNTLDTSELGTGKTVVAAHLAKSLKRPTFVMCPKAVIPSWEEELEDAGVLPLEIINYEKVRTGNTPWMSKRGKKVMTWNLPKDVLVVLDEVHRCKGAYTQNAQLLISLVTQGHSVHCISATAAEDPTEMRALGYALGVHNLNKSIREGGKVTNPSWVTWMQRNGCKKDYWNKWQPPRNERSLVALRDYLYSNNVARLCREQLPSAFKNNRVIFEKVNFKARAKIKKAYSDAGMTPSIVQTFIETGTLPTEELAITEILRARQLAEGMKAPDIAEMAEEIMLEGKSVVIFVNFTETVHAICERLQCPKIVGGQSDSQRKMANAAFQSNAFKCIVVNIKAGGESINLHDISGDHPRVSLISPDFSAKAMYQVLGRINRNGMKSDAVQKILVAEGSVEEYVIKSMERRTKNLKIMQNK